MGTVTTSIVVQFSQGNSGILTAEIDARETGLNGGKTSFLPGDTANFLVFKSDDVTIDSVDCSLGPLRITPLGLGLYQVGDTGEEEWLSFANAVEADLSKPFHSDFVYEWYGNNLGTPAIKGNKVVVPTKGIGMLKVKYKAQYRAYALSSPSSVNGKTDFQVLVVVTGHN